MRPARKKHKPISWVILAAVLGTMCFVRLHYSPGQHQQSIYLHRTYRKALKSYSWYAVGGKDIIAAAPIMWSPGNAAVQGWVEKVRK